MELLHPLLKRNSLVDETEFDSKTEVEMHRIRLLVRLCALWQVDAPCRWLLRLVALSSGVGVAKISARNPCVAYLHAVPSRWISSPTFQCCEFTNYDGNLSLAVRQQFKLNKLLMRKSTQKWNF